MKKNFFLFAILFAAGLTNSRAQDTWTQKADIGGTGGSASFGFSIGNRGYTGLNYSSDFWEYDSAIDSWTQKANFGGEPREFAVGFSIGSKGYAGTGWNDYGDLLNDFWEYDPASNTWAQKANVGGSGRIGAFAFSIGNKGYIGGGNQFICCSNDFWEYDPATDVWTQKAYFGGTSRMFAAVFSIGNKGYVGTGYSFSSGYLTGFWEYDPATDTWTAKANFGGSKRERAVGFSIGDKGYIGTGISGDYYDHFPKKDFWEYDPSTNAWTQKTDFAGGETSGVVGFSIGSKGHIAMGLDFWEYDPGTSSCAVPSNLSATNITSSSAKLKWETVAGAEGYTVRYKVPGNVWKYGTTHGTSKNISGLLPSTLYKWEVQTFCHADPPYVKSDWSSKQEFTTGSLRVGDKSTQRISFQVYPNPAEDHATIQFTLLQSSYVSIKVFDVTGKEMETLLDDDVEQGDHSLQLNTNHFPKGVYLVKMVSDFGIDDQKLIVE